MSVLLDILGALFVSASILLTINYLTANLQRTVSEENTAYMLQQNALSITEIVESDLGRAGYRSPKPAVLAANESLFTYRADIENNGIGDVVTYALGALDAAGTSATMNPHDRPLMRIINSTDSIAMNIGMTSLSFSYLDSLGAVTTTLTDIRAVHLKICLESTEPVDSLYSRVTIDKIIYPRNL